MDEEDIFQKLAEEFKNLMPLAEIAEYLPDDVTANQLRRWAENKRKSNNGFPQPSQTVGVYRLYDRDEVIRWVVLYKRATNRLGNKDLNDG